MGFGGISPWSLILILIIVLLLFGTKRLRNMGSDLGDAIKNFRKSVSDEEKNSENTNSNNNPQEKITQNQTNPNPTQASTPNNAQVINGEAKEKVKDHT